jgi:hypothetical protein
MDAKYIWETLTRDPITFFTFLLAVFTFALAVSTVLLWWVTRRAAKAAELNAKALMSAERAQIFIEIVDENFVKAISGRAFAGLPQSRDVDDQPLGFRPWVRYVFRNHGRTLAVLKEISLSLVLLEELPKTPCYFSRADPITKPVLPAGEATDPEYCNFDGYPTVRDAIRINSKSDPLTLWFYGRVLYNDIFGQGHEHGFLWRFSGNGFRPDYREAYNKNV